MATGQYTQFPIDWKTIDASKVPYSNTSSGMTATDVQNAIDELNTDLNAIDASDVPYDNTASGLTADDVQEALDELASEKQDELTAGDHINITDNTISVDTKELVTVEGIYPGISAGGVFDESAYQTDNAPYLLRASGGDVVAGRQERDELVGGTVVWNQLEKSDRATESKVSVTMTHNNDGSVTFNGTASGSDVFYPGVVSTANKTVKDHVYVWGCVLSATPTGLTPVFRIGAINSANAIHKASASDLALNVGYDIASGTVLNNVKAYSMYSDLTAMLGSQIADYIYTLESGTAGAGIAWLRANGFGHILDNYHAYDSGSLQSVKTSAHKTVGKNMCLEANTTTQTVANVTATLNSDGSWTLNGTANANADINIRDGSAPFIIPIGSYILNGCPSGGGNSTFALSVRISKTGASNRYARDFGSGASFSIGEGEYISRVYIEVKNGYAFSNKQFFPMIRFADVSDATYVPYESHTYPLDSDLELRGIPKLNGSKLYYDGDRYAGDGTVTRKYREVKTNQYVCSGAYRNSLGLWVCSFREIDRNAGSVKKAPISDMLASFPDKTYNSISEDGVVGAISENFIGIIGLTDATSGLSSASTDSEVNNVFSNYLNTREPSFVYELATPTTESADPFDAYQSVDRYGTEEYVDERTVPIPVGHETRYYTDYLSALKAPTANGSYTLKVTVADGVPTYSWVSG